MDNLSHYYQALEGPAVLGYCKRLCNKVGMEFNKRTIVVTALTGAAAVSIFGETVHSACFLNTKKIKTEMTEEWKDTLLVVVDEISFASESILRKINENMNILKEIGKEGKFGGIPIVFAGDFTQLEPVRSQPLFLNTENEVWYDYVNTFIELKTNHRFHQDPAWGQLLQSIRLDGASKEDLDMINTRHVSRKNAVYEHNIPDDAVYATSDNIDKAAINDGIFSLFLSKTHSKDKEVEPPMHTICIKASNIQFRRNESKEYIEGENQCATDIIYATCGDGHVKDDNSKRHDPMLKLYKDRPLCINQNIDVVNCIANGAMCKFKGIILDDKENESCFERILIDGYYVNCVDAKFVKFVVVEMMDGNHDESNPNIVHLSLKKNIRARVKFPIPFDGPIHRMTRRIWRRIKFDQFPLNVANARTVHKLQGRSIRNLVISTWNYRGNWVYVVLSRCSTLNGIFLRKTLSSTKPMSAKCKEFHSLFREQKSPKVAQESVYQYDF